MVISNELKQKLHKPSENALILKNMGRAHTFNFMVRKMRQKGARKRCFTRVVYDLMKLSKFNIFTIFEPRISVIKASKVIKRLGFTDSFVVDADGFSGGIWLLWNSNKLKLHVIASSKQIVTAIVADGNSYWFFSVIYGNPTVSTRRKLGVT
ncbi:hypothetical protein ACOSQ3_031364 [Xanthoceras sorbifolium]